MAEQPERQRVRPTVQGRTRLLAAIDVAGPVHVVDAGTLGEYAELVAVRGHAEATAAFPEVAAHLAGGCASCDEDLRELMTDVAEGGATPGVRDDSGIFAAELPDPRADEAAEAARLQRLRRLRDWLLVAAAAAILLIGLSLVGLAYLASRDQGVRVELVPGPSTAPSPGSAAGRAAPNGMSCPTGFPIKGNRASMIYHQPGAEFYEQTRPEDCFAGPSEAEAAGYRRSQR